MKKKQIRKFQNAELEFAIRGKYLHSIYIVLDVISTLEMI